MPEYPFKQVDVFTRRPLRGNPVAVVLQADALSDAQMQAIATWTNLSETTFVQRPSNPAADYRLRIFAPSGELPFAGHPTVGSAHAVLEAGLVAPDARSLRQECGAGILPLSIEGDGAERRIFTRVPAATIRDGSINLVARLSTALGGNVGATPPPLTISVGPTWLLARLEEPTTVAELRPDMTALAALSRDLGVTGVTVFDLVGGDGIAAHVRSFAPAIGVPEDPVCGSGNACVAVYLARTGLLARTGSSYVAAQGTELGRDGRVSVRVQDHGRCIEIGGTALTVVEGQLRVA